MQIRRTHGIFGGLLLMLLGAWGAIIPFIGPYFHYAYTPDKTWTWSTDRLYLEVLPGGLAFLAGLLLIWAAARHTALFGAVLGVVAGAWFALGQTLSQLWSTGHVQLGGVPAGTDYVTRVLEQIGFFTGLGVAIVLVAAATAGRLTAVGSVPAVSTGPAATVPSSSRAPDEELTTTTLRTLPAQPAPSEDTQAMS